jgi:gas vesicle protein
MSIPKYVSSFAVGFAVGAGLTLIYAPMTGRKMQRRIRDIGERMRDKVDDVKAAVVRVAS